MLIESVCLTWKVQCSSVRVAAARNWIGGCPEARAPTNVALLRLSAAGCAATPEDPLIVSTTKTCGPTCNVSARCGCGTTEHALAPSALHSTMPTYADPRGVHGCACRENRG